MTETRQYPGLALLPGGTVLAVTGHPLGGKDLASAEIYDPGKDTWASTGALAFGRGGVEPGGLIMLDTGKVLIAGGGFLVGSRIEAELFDADLGAWSTTGAMRDGRATHTLTKLRDGRVLATGGIDWATNTVHPSAEVYDPESATWSEAGTMNSPRMNHSAALLPDGRVLVMGGARDEPFIGNVIPSCEIYDPATNAWSPANAMHVARRAFRAVALADGSVLVVGGSSGAEEGARELDACERYDPVTGEWTLVGALLQARWGPTVTLLADGRVLATGGMRGRMGRLRSTEIFDPTAKTWSEGPALNYARNGHRAITLEDGRILIAGGYSGMNYLSSCELYVP